MTNNDEGCYVTKKERRCPEYRGCSRGSSKKASEIALKRVSHAKLDLPKHRARYVYHEYEKGTDLFVQADAKGKFRSRKRLPARRSMNSTFRVNGSRRRRTPIHGIPETGSLKRRRACLLGEIRDPVVSTSIRVLWEFHVSRGVNKISIQ